MKVVKFREKALFSRLKTKDKEAFIRVYDLYIDSIYRFIYFKVGNEADAQDLTSTVFLKTWNHIQNKGISDYKTLKALLYKIARNAIIDHYRVNSLRNNISIDNSGGTIDIVDEKQDTVKRMEIIFDLSLIEKKLLELKDEYREVIILRFVQEMSIGEIADIMDKSKGNVRVLIFRALKSLRELVNNDNANIAN